MRKKSLFYAIALFAVLVFLVVMMPQTYEAFGATSPGTMVQLSTSHVPTEEDADFYMNQYPRIVRRDITEMTGGDPGELRPWIFPWYGRGMVMSP